MIRAPRVARSRRVLPVFAVLLLLSAVARAEPAREPSAADRERAAENYDSALKAYERGEYREAAQRFLAADAIAPNSDAIANAIASARRARAPLLIAAAAERGVARAKSAPSLAERSRAALREADRQLGRVELSCTPLPCELELDGQRVAQGLQRVLPGTHHVAARAAHGGRVERQLEILAGTERPVILDVPAAPATAAAPAPHPAAEPVANASSERNAQAGAAAGEPPAFAKPLFYAGLGTTLALAAATTWSGVDALNARSELPGSQADNEDVLARAHRTDALLAGTLLVGAATAYVGIRFLVGKRSDPHVGLAADVRPDGASLTLSGVYR